MWLGTEVVGVWQVPSLRLQASLVIKGVKMELVWERWRNMWETEEGLGRAGTSNEEPPKGGVI